VLNQTAKPGCAGGLFGDEAEKNAFHRVAQSTVQLCIYDHTRLRSPKAQTINPETENKGAGDPGGENLAAQDSPLSTSLLGACAERLEPSATQIGLGRP